MELFDHGVQPVGSSDRSGRSWSAATIHVLKGLNGLFFMIVGCASGTRQLEIGQLEILPSPILEQLSQSAQRH